VDQEKGYWQRQFYFLSSLGIFYLILIAMFAIPLLGTFVVILIKGALDLRYVIIGVGCVGLIALGWLAVRLGIGMWRRFRRDGSLAGQAFHRSLLLGNPVEISVLNGMLKFTCGQGQSGLPPALPQADQPVLPAPDGQATPGSILDQLQQLSDLKQTGAINDDEFNMLKGMLIESSTSSSEMEKTDPQ
jgi:hypothetical protein